MNKNKTSKEKYHHNQWRIQISKRGGGASTLNTEALDYFLVIYSAKTAFILKKNLDQEDAHSLATLLIPPLLIV